MEADLRLRLGVLLVAAAAMIAQAAQTQGLRKIGRAREYVRGLPVAEGEVLVRPRPGDLAKLRHDVDADAEQTVGTNGWRRIHSSSRSAEALLVALSSRPDVLEVEPNYIVHTTAAPNDPSFPNLWGLSNSAHPNADIHAVAAWDVSTGSPANVVGVVDTGVDYTHPDLIANMWSAPAAFTVSVSGRSITCPAGSHGFNAILFTCDPADDAGHGTHTAGTIGAVGNNAVGVVGVNWTTRIMALKFLDSTGSGTVGDAISAIDFALQTKTAFSSSGAANVRVLSNSWGAGGTASSALKAEIAAAETADVLFVAAAGNSATNNDAAPFYPASYPGANIIAVAATDETDTLAGFSDYGPTSVDLAAPGTNIGSTIPGGGYGTLSGTSMATPHVAGAAMLALSTCALNTAQVKAAILDNVDVLSSLNGIVLTGGRLNAANTVSRCSPRLTPPSVVLTSPSSGASYTALATISLGATANDPDGVKRVEFYANDTFIGLATTSPYQGTWSAVAVGSYTLTARAYDMYGGTSVSSPVFVTVSQPAGRTNVAAAANGATAIGSSTYSSGYAASGAINGDRKGQGWGGGGGWNDATGNVWPDWLEVDFAGAKTIDEVDVFSLQDNYTAPVEPTRTLTFGQYGLTDFTVQYWDGTQWLAVPGGVVSGNTLVWRQVTFSAVTTAKIRVFITGALATWSRVTEVEAYQSTGAQPPADVPPTVSLTGPAAGTSYTTPALINYAATASDSDGTVKRVDFYANGTLVGSAATSPYQFGWTTSATGTYSLTAVATDNLDVSTISAAVTVTVTAPGGRTNVALAANGATAIGSSTYSSGYAASGAINGDRKGQGWGGGGGWNDATGNVWPDWLEVDFAGAKTIDEVDVFSLQDNYTAPVEPTRTLTFGQYGLTDFTVQYWDGTQWLAVPGGVVSGNTLVWRQVTFTALTTTKIRVLVTGALNTWTRVTEVEAYSTAP